MNIAYVRVSSEEQNEARQIAALNSYNIEKWFMDKASGKDTKRAEFQRMLEFAREGDSVFVSEFSRLARSTRDLLNTVALLNEKGVRVVSIKEQFFDTQGPYGALMLTVVAAFAEFERAIIRERQLEGIRIAKAKGTYKGRPPKRVDPEQLKAVYSQYMSRELTKTQAAAQLKISRDTFDSRIKQLKQQGILS